MAREGDPIRFVLNPYVRALFTRRQTEVIEVAAEVIDEYTVTPKQVMGKRMKFLPQIAGKLGISKSFQNSRAL